ncbi:ecdysone 20-monooxygenase-like [Cylas formicarius]|uniref:ecdysone 20-monooxygenase-like n=1 Tax=Cylas formicarius TaxID=197179 RepID=UPI0029584A12|nr:ecdysone 20-monooxygenase-like [Cylas formicarius]
MLDVVVFVLTLAVLFIIGFAPEFVKTISGKGGGIPGPLALPLFGTSWVFSFYGYRFNRLHDFYEDLHRRYGPVVKEETIFNYPVISVFEKGDIEKVFRSVGKYPLRPPTQAIAHYRKSVPARYASTGLTNEQGEKWHELRVSLTTVLTSPKTISDFMPQIEMISDDWVHLLRQKRDANNKIDHLEDLATRIGLEATCALVLGRRMGFLIESHECGTATELAEAVHANFIGCRETQFGFPFWRFFNTTSYQKLANSERAIYELASELIKTADESTKESAVFQSVLNANIDEREKKAAIVDFIAAGIHTLKNSFLFFVYQVAMHPDAQRKILEDPSKAYLKACLMETFRLTPTVGSLARILNSDVELSGHMIEAGTIVLCHSNIACKNDANFKDAAKFWPERWLNEHKTETASNATFILNPFGSGRRICPGKRFIEQVLPVMLDKTVESFEVAVDKPLEVEFEFLLSPKGPVNMTFRDRI